FLVGDPMQSIYRFRKAEVALFLRVAEFGVGGITLRQLTLTDNFRSQAGIVQWVNQRFSALFPKQHDAAQSAIAYAHSHAFRPALEGPAVQFHAVWQQTADTASASQDEDGATQANPAALPPLPEPEHDVVVRLVREAIAGNRGDDDDRNVAILVRARSHARAISRRLSEAGIAHRAVELTRLAQRPVVADLTQLARALAHPADRLAWLCVLRAPWCGLTLASLTTLVGDDHAMPVPDLLEQRADLLTDPDESARLAHVLTVLRDRRNDSGALPFAAWVEDVWRRLGGALAYPTKRDAADAESFFRLLEDLSAYGPPDPARLSDALHRLYASPDPAPQGRNVQIMTMHKSKGLQFDTVILPGLHARAPAEPRRLLWFEHQGGRLLAGPIKPQAEAAADPISQFLARRDARRAEFELDRLLYVASTRARHRLHLVAELGTDARTGAPLAPHRSSLLARLWRVVDDMVPTSSSMSTPSMPPEPTRAMPQGDGLRAEATTLMRMPAGVLRELTGINCKRFAHGGPDDMQNSVAAAQQMLLDAGNQLERITGEVAHAWLEHIAHEGPDGWNAQRIAASAEQIVMQLSRKGLPPRDHQAGHAIVLDTLTATLDDARGRWLLGQSAQREWRLLDARGKQLVVDLAFETEDGWLVVDYKTSLAHADESAAAFEARMRASYTNQLRRYCSAVSAATGSPTRAALYLPRMRLWIDFSAI
nr:UvrD-helicase domain-containing protein [Pseudomonas sp.]